MDGKMGHDFSENLCEEEENVCLIDDHVLICLGAFLEGCVKEMREGVRWHFLGIGEYGLQYGVDGE